MDFSIVGSVLRGFGELYFLLALGALTLALVKPKERKDRILWTSTVLILLGTLPAINLWMSWRHDVYAKEAWGYFKKVCAESSGEKIYKTFTGVRSVVVTKPLPPATEEDTYNQYWYGDPYSAFAHSRRGVLEAAILAFPNSSLSPERRGRGFDFVEIPSSQSNQSSARFKKLFVPPNSDRFSEEPTAESKSRFAVAWEDVSTPEGRKFWVAASRLSIIDLNDKSLVAERIGFLIEPGFGSKAGQRRPWTAALGPRTTCPESHTWSDRWFVLKVLNPEGAVTSGR